MVRNSVISLALIVLFLAPAKSQESGTVIHVKLIGGLSGHPLKLAEVGLELSPDYRELKVKTDEHGVATLHVPE